MKNQEIRNLAKSFVYAFRGLFYCIKNERNMRIHLCAVVLVSFFSWLYGLERGSYLLLLLCFGFVIASEVINTAIEVLVNLESPSYHPYARIAKDLAAGAVLVAALASVVIGAILFLSDFARFWNTIVRIFTSPVFCPIFVVLILLSLLFVFRGKLLLNEKPREKERLNNFDDSAR